VRTYIRAHDRRRHPHRFSPLPQLRGIGRSRLTIANAAGSGPRRLASLHDLPQDLFRLRLIACSG